MKLALIAALAASAAEPSIQLKSVTGTRFWVYEAEVRSAFSRIAARAARGQGEPAVNADGSLTFRDPRFVYDGAPRAIVGSLPRAELVSFFGTCRLLGFNHSVALETAPAPSRDGEKVVTLREDGTLSDVYSSKIPGAQVITAITCRQKD